MRQYHIIKSVILVLIDMWLMVVTCQTLTIIKEGDNSEQFKHESRRVAAIYGTFVCFYTLSLGISSMQIFITIPAKYDDYVNLLVSLFGNYIPIFTVWFAHLKNYSSVGRLLRSAIPGMQKRQKTRRTERVEPSDSSQNEMQTV